MTKSNLYISLVTSILIAMFSSCGNMHAKYDFNDTDTITFNKVELFDSIIDKSSVDNSYSVYCSVNIAMPNDNKLSKVFCKNVLDIVSDSLSQTELISKFINNQFDELGVEANCNKEDNECSDECTNDKNQNYKIDILISPKYNKNGIITFCRNDNTMRNKQLSMKSNTYFTFNVVNHEPVYIDNIFEDENRGAITQILKEQLMRQLKVTDENTLYDMGYFNLDNLVVNNNFEITDEGIAWTFKTYEIACFSIGETRIIVPYSLISHYIKDTSILSQFKTM